MRVRDSHASINGEDSITEMPSGGIDIVGNDGRTMFSLYLKGDTLSIDAGMTCKLNGKILDDRFVIVPKAANCVDLVKVEYKT